MPAVPGAASWEKVSPPSTEPDWPNVTYPPIDYQEIIYYSAPVQKKAKEGLEEVDPELLSTFEKLGIPLSEQKRLAGVAVDAVFDSVSVATTFQAQLAEQGVIFCSFSEALQKHPEIVQKYLGTVVPASDNFFAALNSAVFSDGSFFISSTVANTSNVPLLFVIIDRASATAAGDRILLCLSSAAFAPSMLPDSASALMVATPNADICLVKS